MQRPALFSRSTMDQLNFFLNIRPYSLPMKYEQRKTAAWRENRQVSTAKIWAIIFQCEEILVLLTAVSLLSVWNVTRTKEGSFALAYLLSSGVRKGRGRNHCRIKFGAPEPPQDRCGREARLLFQACASCHLTSPAPSASVAPNHCGFRIPRRSEENNNR